VSVPLFVLLSGALLLRRSEPEPTSAFALKRVRKLGVPLAFWSLVYLAWRHFHYHESLGVQTWIGLLFARPAYYHLWFFYMLISLALFVPWLRAQMDFSPRPPWLGFAVAWGAALVLPQLGHRIAGVVAPSSYFLVLGYGGFFLFGPVLAAWTPSARSVSLILASTIAAWALTVATTYLLTVSPAARSEELMDYLRPNIAAMSLGGFVCLWRYSARFADHSWIQHAVGTVSRGSLTIYALHPIGLELGANGYLGAWFAEVGFPGRALALIAGCLAVHALLRTVPILKSCVP
jgi:surface polysaccharide O-acyltransferase-like enzyme